MSGLPREVLRWIQSLDLTWQVKTPKWDLSNGFLVAEMFSWYFPQEIQMHSFYSGTSLDTKTRNWSLLKTFIKRQNLDIPDQYVEGTIHCKEGASTLLTERMYEILTNRKVKKIVTGSEIDFTDRAYQVKLPMHARSTATKAVKNNLRITEVMADPSLILNSQKAQKIVTDHVEHRRVERLEEPNRFNIKPTLGERSIRRLPPLQMESSEMSQTEKTHSAGNISEHAAEISQENINPYGRESSVHFKEVKVKQLDKTQLYEMPIHGY